MAVPEVTCNADVVLNVSTGTRLVQLGATATNSPTSYEWTILSAPVASTAKVGVKGDFTNGVSTLQNPQLLIDGLQGGDEVDGTYVVQCVATNGEGPSSPLVDKENGQQLIVVLTETLELYLPNDYAWDWGLRYMDLTLRILETRSAEVSVSANDLTRKRLFDKLRAGTNVTLTQYDDGGDEQVEISAAGAGVSTFLALTDTPASYAGQGGKYLKVNATPNAVEFASFQEPFLALSDTPAAYTGQSGKLVRVNGAENALEFTSRTTLHEEELVSTGQTSFDLATQPLTATTLCGFDLQVYKNGVRLRHVATPTTDEQFHYENSPNKRCSFIADTGSIYTFVYHV